MIVKMIVEKQMEWRLAGETEVLGENLPQRHFCPSENPTRQDPGLNPGRRVGKPATNRQSYGAAKRAAYTVAWHSGGALDLYSGGDWFESRQAHRLSWVSFSYFFSVTPGKCQDSIPIRSLLLLLQFFLIRDLSTILLQASKMNPHAHTHTDTYTNPRSNLLCSLQSEISRKNLQID
jgi:hypothetical protein